MFYESADSDKNYINLETVKLELFAGGMSADKEKQISDKIVNKENHRVRLCQQFFLYIEYSGTILSFQCLFMCVLLLLYEL